MPGYIDKKQVYYYYNNSFCYVFPSLDEGFGIPLIEALRARVPVICSDIEIFKARDHSATPGTRTDLWRAEHEPDFAGRRKVPDLPMEPERTTDCGGNGSKFQHRGGERHSARRKLHGCGEQRLWFYHLHSDRPAGGRHPECSHRGFDRDGNDFLPAGHFYDGQSDERSRTGDG